jgi:hypothetical protein
VSPAEAIELAEEIELHGQLRLAAYRTGFEAGRTSAYSAGRADAIADVKRTWHQVFGAVQLAGRRLAPGGDAWLDTVRRHGGTEYGGVGKPRVPVNNVVIETAINDMRGRAA